MKKILFPFLLAGLIFAGISCSSRSKTVDPVLAARVKAVMESRNYTIDIDRMVPKNGPFRSLSFPYKVAINGDVIVSYLPYIGESYAPVMGSPDVLNFTGTIERYELTQSKKGDLQAMVWTNTPEDQYLYKITVYPDGTARIYVKPQRKQSIDFDGSLNLAE